MIGFILITQDCDFQTRNYRELNTKSLDPRLASYKNTIHDFKKYIEMVIRDFKFIN